MNGEIKWWELWRTFPGRIALGIVAYSVWLLSLAAINGGFSS